MNKFIKHGGKFFLLSLLILVVFFLQELNAAPVSGTKTICSSGCNYTTIKAAMDSVRNNGMSGHIIFELKSTYSFNSTNENGFNIFANLPTSASNTITIRPESTVSTAITFNVPSLALNILGCAYVIFDGRKGGTGTSRYFILKNNLSTSGLVMSFTAGCHNNTIKYCEFYGRHPFSNNATVRFSGPSGTIGNSYNTISNCIFGSADSTASCSISFINTSTSPCTGNVISNNEIRDFYCPAGISMGITIIGATNTTISGNSFYQSYPRNGNGYDMRCIYVNGQGNIITNNYFGGSAALAGGQPMQFTGSILSFITIVDTDSLSIVSGNICQNVIYNRNAGTSASSFINVNSKNASVSGNTVGNLSADSSILIHGSTSSVLTLSGFNIEKGTLFTADSAYISANNIGGIHLDGSIGLNFHCLKTSGYNEVLIQDNIIGGVVVNNIINYTPGELAGIWSESSSATLVKITGNTIKKLTHAYGTAGSFFGIYGKTLSASAIISGNNISILTGSGNDTMSGIYVTDLINSGISVLSNSISFLYNSTTSTTFTNGIFIKGSSSVANPSVRKNQIFQIAGTSASGNITGIKVTGTLNATMANNQISISGSSSTPVYGIGYDAVSTSGTCYYNSVYIGGAGGGSSNSAAMQKTNTGTIIVKNNIFFSERTGSGKHYAVSLSTTTGLSSTSTNNLLMAADTTELVLWGSVDKTFSDYTLNCGCDRYSWAQSSAVTTGSVFFTNPQYAILQIIAGNASSWMVDGKGTPISGETDDYTSSNVRSETVSNGPTDIGADEFSSTATVPFATVSGSIGVGQSQNFIYGNKILATITWTSGTSLPTSVSLKYHSGVTPPGTLMNQYSKAYWTIDASGGTNYVYTIILFYDPSILGTNSSQTNLVITKKATSALTWNVYLNSVVNSSQQYITLAGLTSFSHFTITNSLNPLPVELLDFSARAEKNKIILNWTTASEKDNDHFEIERSFDGKSFIKIGEVKGKGNTDFISEYSFNTFSSVKDKIHYYRLKQVDFNRLISYSPVRQLSFENQQEHILFWYDQNARTVSLINQEISTESIISIIDMNGRVVKTTNATNENSQISLADLNPGIYLIIIDNSQEPYTQKIVLN